MYRCLPCKTYGVRKRTLGLASINRQIQKYVANHNRDGPKTKVKMKTFLTALSSVLYSMVSIYWVSCRTVRIQIKITIIITVIM
jgi:hypothetical protein